MLPLLLADVPASFQPAELAPGTYLLVLTAALPSIVGLIVNLFQWLGKRAIDREDKDKDEIRGRLKQHEDRFEQSERAIETFKIGAERRFSDMEHTLITVQAKMEQISSTADNIRGTVAELKTGLENRFEKQSEFYRAQSKEQLAAFAERLEKLEQELRHDMTRAVADSLRVPRGRRR